jgi:5-methylcytosine-specific restriction endonuclease McrA
MKICSKCGEPKQPEDFYKQPRNADGLFTFCKTCHLDKCAKYKAANPDKAKAAVRLWQKAHPERQRAATRRWIAAHPQEQAAAARSWRRRNRAVIAAHAARRRAKHAAQACGCCQPWSFRFIYAQARALGMHVDHVKPLARGGLHCLRNMQLLAPVDNLRKGAR